MKRKIGWYGMRTLFRLVAIGKPKTLDKFFDPTSTLVEDRVVLFKADGFDSAIKQAKDEGRKYSKAIQFANIYGQPVRLKFLGALDAFALSEDEPSAGCEVYSSNAIVHRSVSDAKLVVERFGNMKKRRVEERYKFLDGDILTAALTAIQGLKRTRPGSAPAVVAGKLISKH